MWERERERFEKTCDKQCWLQSLVTCRNDLEICSPGITLQPSLYPCILCKNELASYLWAVKKAKFYLFQLKEKDEVTCLLLQDYYPEGMEVQEVAEVILSGDSDDSLQKIKDNDIIKLLVVQLHFK